VNPEDLQMMRICHEIQIFGFRGERSIKPFVMGRKNWLFCNTPEGAESSAIVYSIIETAKENGLRPFEYLSYIFERMPNCQESEIESLLPWGVDLPENCKIPKIIKEDTQDGKEKDA
jgi:hypothetical protein